MKNLLLLLFVSLFSFAFPQSGSDISYISLQVETINTQSKNYDAFTLKNDKTPASEENVIVFTEGMNKIKLIKETYNYETGKTIISNYLENNQPIFIYKEYYTYKLPITDKNFNTVDLSKKEERFYLKNDRIIKWIIDKKILKTYPKNAASIETNMLEHIESLVTQFMKENKE